MPSNIVRTALTAAAGAAIVTAVTLFALSQRSTRGVVIIAVAVAVFLLTLYWNPATWHRRLVSSVLAAWVGVTILPAIRGFVQIAPDTLGYLVIEGAGPLVNVAFAIAFALSLLYAFKIESRGALAVAPPRSAAVLPPLGAGRIRVIVAQFDLDENESARAGFAESLNTIISADEYLRTLIEIRELPEVVPLGTDAERFEYARRLGQQRDGALVVFGRVTARGMFTRIAIANPLPGISGGTVVPVELSVGALPAADVKSVHAIVKVVAGVSLLAAGRPADAERQLRSALDLLRDLNATQHEGVLLYLANALLTQPSAFAQRFEEATSLFTELTTKATDSLVVVGAYSGLGVSHRRMADYGDKLEHLQSAVDAQRSALKQLTGDTAAPTIRGIVKSNLGIAYEKLAELRDSKANLREAIRWHAAALDDLERDDGKWAASISNNLGVAYHKLSHLEDPVVNLGHALEAYRTAIQLEDEPKWEDVRGRAGRALTWSNLGDAYGDMARHTKSKEDVAQAVTALEKSISMVKCQEAPEVFAEAHYKLGMTLALQTDQRVGSTVPESLVSLACSLVVFERLGSAKAEIARQALLLLIAKIGKEEFVRVLGSQPIPDGCEFRIDDVLRMLEAHRPPKAK